MSKHLNYCCKSLRLFERCRYAKGNAALKVQVHRDFAPIGGIGADLTFTLPEKTTCRCLAISDT